MTPRSRLKGASRSINLVATLIAGIIFIALLYAMASGVMEQGVSEIVGLGLNNTPPSPS